MSKLITRKIRNLEHSLVDANSLLRTAQGLPLTDPSVVASLKTIADGYEAALEQAMDAAPEEVSRDTMPAEVATELLSSPLARITAPMRRACRSAREVHYVSVTTPVPGATKLAARFSRAKLTQLGKWLRRCIYRRYRVQKAIDALAGKKDAQSVKLREFFIAKSVQLDVTRAQIEAELHARSEKAGVEVGIPAGFQLANPPAVKPESFVGRSMKKFARLFAGFGGISRGALAPAVVLFAAVVLCGCEGPASSPAPQVVTDTPGQLSLEVTMISGTAYLGGHSVDLKTPEEAATREYPGYTVAKTTFIDSYSAVGGRGSRYIVSLVKKRI